MRWVLMVGRNEWCTAAYGGTERDLARHSPAPLLPKAWQDPIYLLQSFLLLTYLYLKSVSSILLRFAS